MNTNSKRKAAQIAKQHSARRVAKREQKRREIEAARLAEQEKKEADEKLS